MEQMLEAFRNDRDPSRLRLFEQLRADPAMNEGINAFWTAVLNIRLNSVPLINPEAGLIGSIEACRMTRQQIETSLQK